jgi:RHS repeat-associated protein
VRLTDTAGAVVQSLAYDPFGFTVYSGGVSEPSNQYTGQKKDGSGLYYYGARYYDPELGRFISPDRLLVDGLNRYAYCKNNPIKYIDPTGKYTEEQFNEGQRIYNEQLKNEINTSETTGGTSYRDEEGRVHILVWGIYQSGITFDSITICESKDGKPDPLNTGARFDTAEKAKVAGQLYANRFSRGDQKMDFRGLLYANSNGKWGIYLNNGEKSFQILFDKEEIRKKLDTDRNTSHSINKDGKKIDGPKRPPTAEEVTAGVGMLLTGAALLAGGFEAMKEGILMIFPKTGDPREIAGGIGSIIGGAIPFGAGAIIFLMGYDFLEGNGLDVTQDINDIMFNN